MLIRYILEYVVCNCVYRLYAGILLHTYSHCVVQWSLFVPLTVNWHEFRYNLTRKFSIMGKL
jgi:hypothetical protein